VLEYVVERGVPLPPAQCGRRKPPGHGRRKYPFNEMEVGDSFAVFLHATDLPVLSQLLGRLTFASCGYAARKNNAPQFACRTLPEENCVRVWRVR
jgi:hypothetical protein